MATLHNLIGWNSKHLEEMYRHVSPTKSARIMYKLRKCSPLGHNSLSQYRLIVVNKNKCLCSKIWQSLNVKVLALLACTNRNLGVLCHSLSYFLT